MQRIEVTEDGVTVTLEAQPLVSVFGKETRPGVASTDLLPWGEISSVSLSATRFAPDGRRWVTLTVDTTWGEYFEVHEDTEGLADAVLELCRMSGFPAPDARTLTASGQVIWKRPGPS
ncbi:hypothetical protein DMB66_43190 [Actinoplanes sp. ATCC 53533]|uniref:hypothetical protein n=2 Tax=Actinoplanes sp. ATCC 53533 TaxID=1288362 RepID=UPI000F79D065|nr:hypothetical protein [Actinoplanes sp. ATCC 53533]RSM50537.1 hypothetical protein DMB66_43190 [Actinoplanes sp. ATCC 53533]